MQLHICRTLEQLVEILRERRDELGLTNEVLEALSGISDGYAAKLLSARPIKRLGPMSLGAILGALALKVGTITIEHDETAAAVMAPQWSPRRGRPREQRERPRRASPWPVAWDLVYFVPASEPKRQPERARLVRCCSVQQSVFDFCNSTEATDMKLIGARCDDGLAEQVEAAAAKERRPVSQFVRNVLTDAVTRLEPGAANADKPNPEVTA
jgi:hypothetical protein